MIPKRDTLLNQDVIDPSDDNSVSPEQRLWAAVIEKSVQDFRELFAKIAKQIARTNTYNAHFFYEYKSMKYELEHQFFVDACDFANCPHGKVIDLFKREAKASGLFDYEAKVPKFASHAIKRLRGWH